MLMLRTVVLRHFSEQGIKPDLYFMEWAMTLFCKRLKLGTIRSLGSGSV